MPANGDPQDRDRDKNGSADGNNNNNLFIRFKDHVDFNVHRGYEIFSSMLWNLPSAVDEYKRTHNHKDATQNGNSPSSGNVAPPPVLSHDATASPNSASVSPNPQRRYENKHNTEDLTDVDAVYNWALQSPYSPLNLQHLRQPVPRDAPHYYHFSFTFPPWSSSSTSSPSSSSPSPSSNADGDPQFTFRDAFEDLLFVNAGYPLPDLRGRLFGRLFDEFPLGRRWRSFTTSTSAPSSNHPEGGLHVADWTARLGYLGLWHSYFPELSVPAGAPVAERHAWGSGLLSDDPWLVARRRLLAAVEREYNDGNKDVPLPWFKPTKSGAFGGWDKVWDWGWNGKGSLEWPQQVSRNGGKEASNVGGDGSNDEASSQQPDVEEDLYDWLAATEFQESSGEQQEQPPQQSKAITSSSSTTARTAVAASSEQDPAVESQSITDSESIETTDHPDGGKTVRTVRRHIDRTNGRNKTETTIERYDAEGNVVARSHSTMSQRTWSSESSSGWGDVSSSLTGTWNADGEKVEERREVEASEKTPGSQQQNGKKGGWFWTK